MKSLHLYLKKIAIISFAILFFNCTNPKVELENAQSQNIEFLIEQATNLWEKRSDTNAVKQANYFCLKLCFQTIIHHELNMDLC